MTDARLMDADCIHGIVWWSCKDCCDYLGEPVRSTPDEVDEVQHD